MTDSPQTADSDASGSAADRLQAGAAELTVPEPMASAESMLLKLGFVLPVVGCLLIMLAWWGRRAPSTWPIRFRWSCRGA